MASLLTFWLAREPFWLWRYSPWVFLYRSLTGVEDFFRLSLTFCDCVSSKGGWVGKLGRIDRFIYKLAVP